MKKSSADRNFNTCADTTTDDPIIRESRHKGQVFATDHILATLMTAGRSVIPWDIIVRRIGDKLFFDKRATSNIDKISVNETANDPPSEENNTGINDPRNLTLEATYVNKGFSEIVYHAQPSFSFRSTMSETGRVDRPREQEPLHRSRHEKGSNRLCWLPLPKVDSRRVHSCCQNHRRCCRSKQENRCQGLRYCAGFERMGLQK